MSRSKNSGMRDQTKSAVGMRIRGRTVGMNDLYRCKEGDNKQAQDTENSLPEEPGARLGSRLEHRILGLGVERRS